MGKISDNIKYLRKKQGFTQQQFADVMQIKRSLVGAYEEERAEPKYDLLQKEMTPDNSGVEKGWSPEFEKEVNSLKAQADQLAGPNAQAWEQARQKEKRIIQRGCSKT